MIDQHAAHERIFYERFLDQYRQSEKLQQALLTPFVVNVSHSEKSEGEIQRSILNQLGFEIEDFGPKAYIVKAVPIFTDLSQAENFLNYFLENFSQETTLEDKAKIDKIISNSCKSAIKGNQMLSFEEMKQLLCDLSHCENPYSCPHGRPTFVKLTRYQIEKMFKRV